MLPRIHRLPLRLQRNSTTQSGVVHPGRYFSLVVSPSDPSLPTRFAVILSKKIAKTAVDRNLLRRRLHQAAALYLSGLKPGFNVIILAKHPLTSASFTDIAASFQQALSRSGLLNLKS